MHTCARVPRTLASGSPSYTTRIALSRAFGRPWLRRGGRRGSFWKPSTSLWPWHWALQPVASARLLELLGSVRENGVQRRPRLRHLVRDVRGSEAECRVVFLQQLTQHCAKLVACVFYQGLACVLIVVHPVCVLRTSFVVHAARSLETL